MGELEIKIKDILINERRKYKKIRELSQKINIHLTGIPQRMNNIDERKFSKTIQKKNLRIGEHGFSILKGYAERLTQW